MTTSRGFSAAALAAALLLAPEAARAGHRGRNVSTHHDGDPMRCSDLSIEFDDRPASRAEQSISIPVDSGKPLRVQAAESSGVSVHGTDRSDFQVTLCKGAEAEA